MLSSSVLRRSRSSAALSAAPSMVSTRVTSGWLASSRMRRPSSTLLPSRRTTSGLVASSPRISSAPTMPLATSSQAVMPPKTFTNTLLTCASWRITSRPSAITWALAPPPMSRKLAGFTPPCVLAGVRDDVEGRHDQARAVADDADRAVELDVVEALVLGLRLERVGLLADLELRVVRVAELGVLVERDLAVERLELVAGQPGQRVDLDQRGVLLDEDLPQLLDHLDGLVDSRLREPASVDDRRGPWPRRRRCPGRSGSA